MTEEKNLFSKIEEICSQKDFIIYILVGLGTGVSERGYVFVVARLYPPGNQSGKFLANLPSVEGAKEIQWRDDSSITNQRKNGLTNFTPKRTYARKIFEKFSNL